MSQKILIVDDDERILLSLSDALGLDGYRVFTAENARAARALIEKEIPDIILTDLVMGETSGLDVLRDTRGSHPDIPVVIMTAYADLGSAIEALRRGAADYISKPFQIEGLKLTLNRAMEAAALRGRLRSAHRRRQEKFRFASIVAESPAMREALELARKISADANGTILILGESGCGKDLLARSIHYESPRQNQPFMEISCTAIPGTLLESELFGYERGAFSGAQRRKKGLFELADGGTVFLNEIGHMPLELQGKVLRLIEEKAFKRVGGVEDIRAEVRITAATNEDLSHAMREGSFREDLFFRLNVLPIRLKPLRERPEDILPLARSLLSRLCPELRRTVPELSEDCRRALLEYRWPGNVRELRNVLERMLILRESDIRRCLMPQDSAASTRRGGREPGRFILPPDGIPLEDVEKTLVFQAVERTGGNKQAAARLLGLSRDALRRRLEKFGLIP